MPQPSEVGALADPLASAYQRASLRIDELIAELQNDPGKFAKRRALIERQKAILADMRDLDSEAAEWVSKQLPKAYALGGAAGTEAATGGAADFVWSQVHQEATQRIATNLYQNLLAATKHVSQDVKTLVRKVGKDAALSNALEGRTARQAGREMARILRSNGVHAITYANGAKHGLGSYAEMAVRTVSATTYNEGSLNSAAEHGTQYWEVFDGPFCGWASHDDRQALGMIVTRDEAAGHPISHPNCRRAFGPRPDIVTPEQAKDARGSTTESQREAQIAADANDRRASMRRAEQGGEVFPDTPPPEPSRLTDAEARELVSLRVKRRSYIASIADDNDWLRTYYAQAHLLSDPNVRMQKIDRRFWGKSSTEINDKYVATRKRVETEADDYKEWSERLTQLEVKAAEPLDIDLPEFDAKRWDDAPNLSEGMTSRTRMTADRPDNFEKLRDSYVVNDDQTVAHNRSLRSPEPTPASKSWGSRMERMTKSSETTEDTIAWRGVALEPADIAKIQPGVVTRDPGILSIQGDGWGTPAAYVGERIKATPGLNPVYYKLHVPKGTRMADVQYGEFVLGRNIPMMVRSKRWDADQKAWFVEVEVNPAKLPEPKGVPGRIATPPKPPPPPRIEPPVAAPTPAPAPKLPTAPVKPTIPDPPSTGGLFDGLPTNDQIRKAHPGWTTARAEKELTRLKIDRVPSNEAIRKSHVGWTAVRAEKERARMISEILDGKGVEMPKAPPKPPAPPKPKPKPTSSEIYKEVEEALMGRKFAGGRAKQVARAKEWERIAERHGISVQDVAELYAQGKGSPVTLKAPPKDPVTKPTPGPAANKKVLDIKELTDDELEKFGIDYTEAWSAARLDGKRLTPYQFMKSDRPDWKLNAKQAEEARHQGVSLKYDTARKPVPGISDDDSLRFHNVASALIKGNSYKTDRDLRDAIDLLGWTDTYSMDQARSMFARGQRLIELQNPSKVKQWARYGKTTDWDEVKSRVNLSGVERHRVDDLVKDFKAQYDRTPEAASFLKRVEALDDRAVQRQFPDHSGGVNAYYTPTTQVITLNMDRFSVAGDRARAHSASSGWHTKSGRKCGATATFAHEFGHHIDTWTSTLDYSSRGRIFQEIEDAIRESLPPGRRDLLTPIGNTRPDLWVAGNKSLLSDLVSQYGSTNPQELMAEIWSEYTGNQARPHIKRIGDFILLAAKGERVTDIPRKVPK